MNFKEKYDAMSKPAKASLWFVFSNVIVKGISFLTLPIFSRILTTSEYGVVSVYSSWVSLVTIVTTLTIWGGVFNVAMVKYEDRKNEILSSFQGMAMAITLLALLITIPFMSWFSGFYDMSQLLVVCMYIEVMLMVPYNLWVTAMRYEYEYRSVIFTTVIIAILNPVIGYIAVVSTNQYRAEARILSSFVIYATIGFIFFVRNWIKGKKLFSKDLWKFGFLFNVVLIPHYLSTQILNQSDRLMINKMCGSSDAGIYSVAYNFAMLLSLITGAVNSSVTPYIYKTMKSGKVENLKNRATAVVLFVAIMTLGMICFVPDIFMLLLPENYYPALKVIPPVTAAAFFLFLYPLFGSIEFYFEKNWYVTTASVIGAIMNICLNYIFIKQYGFMAAAYTTLFCYICFSICHYFFMKKILRENGITYQIYDVRSIVLISVMIVVITLGMEIFYEQRLIRWCCLLVIFVVCFFNRNKLVYTLNGIIKKD